MGQSLSQLYVDLICSTKQCQPLRRGAWRSQIQAYLVQYIEQQETHYSATSFPEEYRRFLQLYEVEYDER